jgi:hypothetical protein
VGVVTDVEENPGSFDIAHIKDASGHVFATRKSNLFTLGKDAEHLSVALPRGKGIKLDIFEQRLVAAAPFFLPFASPPLPPTRNDSRATFSLPHTRPHFTLGGAATGAHAGRWQAGHNRVLKTYFS